MIDAYFADIIQAYREEFKELYDIGCRNIQVDGPIFTFFCDETMLNGMKKDGVDSEAILNLYIKTHNEIIKDHPADLTIGVHLCRGNYNGVYFAEGGYDRIAVKSVSHSKFY
jgi:methionine synthase II (cobalamin-independent)